MPGYQRESPLQPKRKRTAPHKGPYKSSDQAVQSVIKSKQFSGRVNYDVLRGLGLTGSSTVGLVAMEDEKEEYEQEDEEEKGEGTSISTMVQALSFADSAC